MHRTGTKHIVRHMQKSVVQWSVISKFTCIAEQFQQIQLNTSNIAAVNTQPEDFKIALLLY